MEFLALFGVGLITGVASSFFGIGGGIIAIPLLMMIFPGMPVHSVLGTSLLMTLLNTSRNSYAFFKDDLRVSRKLIVPLIISIVIGSIIGGQLALISSGALLKKILGIYLLLAVIKLLFFKTQSSHEKKWLHNCENGAHLKTISIGFMTGMVSVMAGVGGGVVLVPLFIMLLNMPFRSLTIYSNMAMIFTSLTGVLTYLLSTPKISLIGLVPYSHLMIGQIHPLFSLTLFLGGALTYRIGIKLNKKVSNRLLKNLFIALLTIVILKIFLT